MLLLSSQSIYAAQPALIDRSFDPLSSPFSASRSVYCDIITSQESIDGVAKATFKKRSERKNYKNNENCTKENINPNLNYVTNKASTCKRNSQNNSIEKEINSSSKKRKNNEPEILNIESYGSGYPQSPEKLSKEVVEKRDETNSLTDSLDHLKTKRQLFETESVKQNNIDKKNSTQVSVSLQNLLIEILFDKIKGDSQEKIKGSLTKKQKKILQDEIQCTLSQIDQIEIYNIVLCNNLYKKTSEDIISIFQERGSAYNLSEEQRK